MEFLYNHLHTRRILALYAHVMPSFNISSHSKHNFTTRAAAHALCWSSHWNPPVNTRQASSLTLQIAIYALIIPVFLYTCVFEAVNPWTCCFGWFIWMKAGSWVLICALCFQTPLISALQAVPMATRWTDKTLVPARQRTRKGGPKGANDSFTCSGVQERRLCPKCGPKKIQINPCWNEVLRIPMEGIVYWVNTRDFPYEAEWANLTRTTP